MTTRSDVSWQCAGRDWCMYALIYKRVHSYTYSRTHEYWDRCKTWKYTQNTLYTYPGFDGVKQFDLPLITRGEIMTYFVYNSKNSNYV